MWERYAALSGDQGIGELKEIVTAGDPGEPAAERGGYEREHIADGFQAPVWRSGRH